LLTRVIPGTAREKDAVLRVPLLPPSPAGSAIRAFLGANRVAPPKPTPESRIACFPNQVNHRIDFILNMSKISAARAKLKLVIFSIRLDDRFRGQDFDGFSRAEPPSGATPALGLARVRSRRRSRAIIGDNLPEIGQKLQFIPTVRDTDIHA
jgi:hypothetical protein